MTDLSMLSERMPDLERMLELSEQMQHKGYKKGGHDGWV
jgi:hypothetical protein